VEVLELSFDLGCVSFLGRFSFGVGGDGEVVFEVFDGPEHI
jgi:hypothetical protein